MTRTQPIIRALYCLIASASALCQAGPTISGTVLGTDGKGIAGAVVFLQDVAPSQSSTHRPAQIVDQINKTFVPDVLPIVVGTLVRFPNHDQIHHHVYSFSPAKTFELPLYKGEDAAPVLFDKVGVVKIGCNIHDWMSGIILVLPNSYFSVTDADGHYTLSDLPTGAHAVTAWHALSKLKTEETARTVQIGEVNTEVSFTLPLAPARPRRAMHGARSEP